MYFTGCEKYFTVFDNVSMFVYIDGCIMYDLMCIARIQLSSSEDQPEADSSGSMIPLLTQRSSPLMFQHLQLLHTQQPILEGIFLLTLTIPLHMEQVTTCF